MNVLHSVIISYNRLHLTKQTVRSYRETVTLPYTLYVVDNGSDAATVKWLSESAESGMFNLLLLGENRYPGYACNRGWEQAPAEATFLHRSDNDFMFLPGWCEEAMRRFGYRRLGQLGLRTKDEELGCRMNVGGNNIIRRQLWDQGLRYDERPWGEGYSPGWSEDCLLSPAVVAMGWKWGRVKRPCIQSLASGDWSDPYYAKSYRDRGIEPHPLDPTAHKEEE